MKVNDKDKEKNSNKKILQVRNYTLFCDLFNDITTLEWIVSKILDCKYEDVKGRASVNKIKLKRFNKQDINKYLDLIVEFEKETILIIINNNFNKFSMNDLLYVSNAYLDNYVEPKSIDFYKKIVRIVSVNLNWSNNTEEKINSKYIYDIPNLDHKELGYFWKIININLNYYKKLCYQEVDNSDKFYKLLTIDNQDDLEEIVKYDKLLTNYSNKFKNLSNNSKCIKESCIEYDEKS